MKVGDLVRPKEDSTFVLHSGAGFYKEAVVISLEPFILTSVESDMRWEHTIIDKTDEFEVIGDVDEKVLKNCMRRL